MHTDALGVAEYALLNSQGGFLETKESVNFLPVDKYKRYAAERDQISQYCHCSSPVGAFCEGYSSH